MLSGAIASTNSAAQAISRMERLARSSMIASSTTPTMTNARWVGTLMPESSRYAAAPTRAQAAAHFLIGARRATGSISASRPRVAKKMNPAIRPTWSPEIASRCARPDSRIALSAVFSIALRSPVRSAAANGPAEDDACARIRDETQWRTRESSESRPPLSPWGAAMGEGAP